MVRKNKLYKHHKSKAFFLIRNFSFIFLGLISVGVGVTVPTYIASTKSEQVPLKADYDESQKEDNKVDSEENVEPKELLHY